MKLLILLFVFNISFAQDTVSCDCDPPKSILERILSPWILEILNITPKPEPKPDPLPPLIEIRNVDYKRNERATFCKRPLDLIDTIVLHHSQGNSTQTAENINKTHLTRGSKNDPWLMIAYHYVINSPYSGGKGKTSVSSGRPIEISGSHAGTNAMTTLDEKTKKRIETELMCGNDKLGFKASKNNVANGNQTKINNTSIGVVVVGNYAAYSRANPSGYPAHAPRYPSEQTLDLTARLICQIQRENPSVTKITWHNMYTPTLCPGTIERRINELKMKAKEYGCEFQ